MDIGAIFLLLALVVLVGIFLARPFLVHNADQVPLLVRRSAQLLEHQRSALMAERDRVLNSLQELDADYSLGKVPAETYPGLRAELLQAGAAALRQLDELGKSRQAEKPVEEKKSPSSAAGSADLEQMIASRAAETDELERMIAARRRTRKEQAAGFCPRCGKPVAKNDKFCPKCGFSLSL